MRISENEVRVLPRNVSHTMNPKKSGAVGVYRFNLNLKDHDLSILRAKQKLHKIEQSPPRKPGHLNITRLSHTRSHTHHVEVHYITYSTIHCPLTTANQRPLHDNKTVSSPHSIQATRVPYISHAVSPYISNAVNLTLTSAPHTHTQPAGPSFSDQGHLILTDAVSHTQHTPQPHNTHLPPSTP